MADKIVFVKGRSLARIFKIHCSTLQHVYFRPASLPPPAMERVLRRMCSKCTETPRQASLMLARSWLCWRGRGWGVVRLVISPGLWVKGNYDCRRLQTTLHDEQTVRPSSGAWRGEHNTGEPQPWLSDLQEHGWGQQNHTFPNTPKQNGHPRLATLFSNHQRHVLKVNFTISYLSSIQLLIIGANPTQRDL